ncbi:tetratricopeptide repeat protein [bacterium]|nr:tetratricopeptide repeat protein [bacterium]MDB4789933.1 tetratricopeptide repeat protein [bacterium]
MKQCIDIILKKADDCYSIQDFLGASKNIKEAVSEDTTNAELWATWGNVEFQAGNFGIAIQKYREACRLSPQTPEYLTYLAVALLQDDNVEEFEISLESALNIDPFHVDALKLLGDLCFRNNKKTEAAHSYYKILVNDPDNTEVLMRLGCCLYECGEIDVAKECYERVLKIDSKNDMALDNLSACNKKIHNKEATQDLEPHENSVKDSTLHDILEDAEFFSSSGNTASTAETLEHALRLAPKEAIIVSALGSVYFKLGKYEKAREMFRKEIELNPRDADAYTRLAMSALFSERVYEFESAIGIALEINPDHLEALRFLGKINLQSRRYLDAAKIFAKLIELNSEFTEFYLALGYAFYEGGEKETARTVFERVLEIDSDNACAINNLRYMTNPDEGLFLSHTIQNEETVVECEDLADKLVDFELAYWEEENNDAKSILSKAYNVIPENYEVITALSTLFFQLGEFKKAKDLVEKAIKLDDSAPEGWIQLALIELNLENLDASIIAIDKSLENFPSTDARKLKAKVLYLKDNHDKALVEFDKLSREYPEDIYLMQCTAICQYKTGETDAAMNTYRHILELDPKNEMAKSNIEAISTLLKKDAPVEGDGTAETDQILHRANESYQLGDIEAAIQEIEKAMSTQPSNPALYATLGSLEFEFGQTDKAVKNLRKAVQIEGDSADFTTRLALAEFTAGNTDKFKKYINSALELDSRYTPALKVRADFNLSISSHKKAATDYVDIIKIEPKNVEALLALAVCFYETGDKDATTMTYERVLSIDPDNTLAKDNLTTVKNSS